MGYTPSRKGLGGEGTNDVFLVNKVFRAKCTKPVYYYYGSTDKPGNPYWANYLHMDELANPDSKLIVDHGIVVPVDCYLRGHTGVVRTTKGTGGLEIILHKISSKNGYSSESEEILAEEFPLDNHVNPNPVNSQCLVELMAGDVIMLYVRRVLVAGFLGWSRHVHGTVSLIFERKQ